MAGYEMLCARRKYEDLNIVPFAFSVVNYDEAGRNYDIWEALLSRAQEAHGGLGEEHQPSFFEIVLHPLPLRYTPRLRSARRRRGTRSRRTRPLRRGTTGCWMASGTACWSRRTLGMVTGRSPGRTRCRRLRRLGRRLREATGRWDLRGGRPRHGRRHDYALPRGPVPPLSETRHMDVFMREKGALSYTLAPNALRVTARNPRGDISTDGTHLPRAPHPFRQLVAGPREGLRG